jgi:hypothetical protein
MSINKRALSYHHVAWQKDPFTWSYQLARDPFYMVIIWKGSRRSFANRQCDLFCCIKPQIFFQIQGQVISTCKLGDVSWIFFFLSLFLGNFSSFLGSPKMSRFFSNPFREDQNRRHTRDAVSTLEPAFCVVKVDAELKPHGNLEPQLARFTINFLQPHETSKPGWVTLSRLGENATNRRDPKGARFFVKKKL